jgi:MFS family permease
VVHPLRVEGTSMEANTGNLDYKDRTRVMAVIGVFLLLVGIAVGFLGPIEMYCFYLFSEGGRFHYEGFGFGSFMFGNIASQIVGYYLIAALFIPLGYGHLKMRRWARTLSLTLLWSWLVVGAPLSVVVFFILAASKDLSLPAALMALVFLGLSYLVFPGLLIRFYQGRNVRRTFETKDTKSYWVEELPMPILVLSSLYGFYIIMLHLLILFNGMFPVLGVFRFGLQGIVLLDISIACLIGLMWGTLRRRLWAWWGSVTLLGLFTFSTVLTLLRSSYSTILSGLNFPPREIEFLRGLPVQGFHFAVLVGIPLFITWGVAILSKRHFRQVIES